MRFGAVPVDQTEGALLAHSVALVGRRLPKAKRLDADDIKALIEAGVQSVVAAMLEPGDLEENAAAEAIVQALDTKGVTARPASTGRVNLHAAGAGVFTVSAALVDAVNAIDPAVTLATLPAFARVDAGQMVATVKIIPFAVASTVIEQVTELCRSAPAFAVHTFAPKRVGMIQTVLPSVKDSVLDKTVEATRARLARSGSTILSEQRASHEPRALAAALGSLAPQVDMAVLFGASAMADFDDVVPAAIRVAGGEVLYAGMPVDPGNLLVLGRLGSVPVIGAPGCARSPKENGFDWVLDRLIAGLEVTPRDIAGMGVGGLLMEIPTRPQPREARKAGKPKVHAILLAAGRSSRMGGPNKLMALFDGEPLVRRLAEQAAGSRATGLSVVTGHQGERIRQALSGLTLDIADNPDFAEGLSTSLKAGIAAVPAMASGALVVLGDMPRITSADLDRLIETFERSGGMAVVRASHFGKRGNPVILPRALFEGVRQLQGDTGARHLVEAHDVEVIDVELGEGAFIDVDTPEALAGAGGVLQD